MDPRINKDFVFKDKTIDKELVCPVCSDPLYKSKMHTCGNAFCGICIEKILICPLCNAKLDNLIPPLMINKWLLKKMVICLHCFKEDTLERYLNTHFNEECTQECKCGFKDSRKAV